MLWCGDIAGTLYDLMTVIARFLGLSIMTLASFTFVPTSANAHPHVFVTMKGELVYAQDGSVTGIRHIWTFDDMYSAFATQGLDSKQPGVFTREELAELAEVNVTSLKEFDYFTFAKANGKKALFIEPKDYWLEYKDSLLSLHFMLPFKAPVKAQDLQLEVYDPSYFIDFSFADKDAVALSGAPAQCKLALAKPTDQAVDFKIKSLSEAAFQGANNYGLMFANRISVTCP